MTNGAAAASGNAELWLGTHEGDAPGLYPCDLGVCNFPSCGPSGDRQVICRAAKRKRYSVKKFFSANDQVLPRPVELLPEYASAKARNPLVERLIAAFEMSEEAAQAIANAVVDPSTVR